MKNIQRSIEQKPKVDKECENRCPCLFLPFKGLPYTLVDGRNASIFWIESSLHFRVIVFLIPFDTETKIINEVCCRVTTTWDLSKNWGGHEDSRVWQGFLDVSDFLQKGKNGVVKKKALTLKKVWPLNWTCYLRATSNTAERTSSLGSEIFSQHIMGSADCEFVQRW